LGGDFRHPSAIALTVAVAYFATPTAIRLLGKPRIEPVNVRHASNTHLCSPDRYCIGASEPSDGSGQSTFLSRSSETGILSFDVVASLVGAIPYRFLFIALTLVAHPIETKQQIAFK
jgi:hypothetical protein